MKKLLVTLLSLPLVAAFSTPAVADTYLVITNLLNEDITIDGNTIKPNEAGWTPLDATIRTKSQDFFSIKDAHQKTAAGWKVAATGPSSQTKSAYIPLGVGEVGCVLTEVLPGTGSGKRARPYLYMHKVSGGVCSSRWQKQAGMPFAKDIIEQFSSIAKSIAEIKSK